MWGFFTAKNTNKYIMLIGDKYEIIEKGNK